MIIVAAVGVLSAMLAHFARPDVPMLEFFGPIRWWNGEVNSHTTSILEMFRSPEALRGLFAGALPSGIGDGYNYVPSDDTLDAAVELRFLPGHFGYASFPPGGFLILFALGGFAVPSAPAVLPLLSAIIPVVTAAVLSHTVIRLFHVARRDRIALVALTVSCVTLLSPVALHYDGVILWTYSLMVFVISLGLYALTSLPARPAVWMLGVSIAVLPWISWTGSVPAIALALATLAVSRQLSSARQRLVPFVTLLASWLVLGLWLLLTFREPAVAISRILTRAEQRRGDELEQTGVTALVSSVFDSFGPWIYVALLGVPALIWLLVRRRLPARSLAFFAVSAASATETVVLAGHAVVYPFAQMLFIPIIAMLSVTAVIVLTEALDIARLTRLTITVIAAISLGALSLWAVGDFARLYDVNMGYYAYDEVPRPFHRDLLGNTFPMPPVSIR